MTGTIKFYNDAKGYGFITPDDGGNTIFVHISNCADDIEVLSEGQRVRYEEGTSARNGRPEARNVSLIG
jgi:CspA family cold shock protein